MNTKIRKWGNSLAVRLPRSITEKQKLHEGSFVAFTEEHGAIIIRPARTTDISLKELVRSINTKNIHGEIGFGKPQGKELW